MNKVISRYKVPILCGIKVKDDQVVFNWDTDDKDDVIHLTGVDLGSYNKDGIRYFYGYSYNPSCSMRVRKTIRDYLKGISGTDQIFHEDVEDFVDNALLNLDAACSISEFSVLVSTQSSYSGSLVDLIRNRLTQFLASGHSLLANIELVKATYNDVKLDVDKLQDALSDHGLQGDELIDETTFILNKFNNLKSTESLFQMKQFVPPYIRQCFSQFLRFKNKQEESLYNSLQGVDVLLFDDFLTSGTTINEMIRCLRSIHDNNRLTVFVLVKQH